MLASFLACSVLFSSFLNTSTVSSRSLLSRSFSCSFSSSALSSPCRADGNKAKRLLKQVGLCRRRFNKHTDPDVRPTCDVTVLLLQIRMEGCDLRLSLLQHWRHPDQHRESSERVLLTDGAEINNTAEWCVRGLLFVLQLQCFAALPQSVVLFGERDVSRLQLLQQPLALVEPAQGIDLLHT